MKIKHHTIDCKTGKVSEVEAEHPGVLSAEEAAKRDKSWAVLEAKRAADERAEHKAMQEAASAPSTHPGIAVMLRRMASAAPVLPARDPCEGFDAGWRWNRETKAWTAPQ